MIKRCIAIISIFILIVLCLSQTAFAADTNGILQTTDKDGIRMTIEVKQVPFNFFRRSDMTVSFQNLSGYTLEDIEIDREIPEGLVVSEKKGLNKYKIDELEPDEVVTFTYKVRAKLPVLFAVIGFTVIGMILLATAAVILLAAKKKRKSVQATALVLVITFLLSNLSVVSNAGTLASRTVSIDNNTVDVLEYIKSETKTRLKQEIQSDNKNYEFEFSLEYTAPFPISLVLTQNEAGFTLNWTQLDDVKSYSVLQRINESDYYTMVTLEPKETSYQLTSYPSETPQFLCVSALLKDGTVIISNEVLFIESESRYFIDSDSDIIPDIYELEFGTSPTREDTDGDGLSDYFELISSMTNPLLRDTDANGVPDSDEDPDNDALTNLDEFLSNTQPHNPDTDGDGLTDGFELLEFLSDPLLKDTDGDGLNDYLEHFFSTSPVNKDSDGDGILDSEEVFSHEITSEQTKATLKLTAQASSFADVSIIEQTDETILKDLSYLASEIVTIDCQSPFESATITIPVNMAAVESGNLNDVAMFYYNPELNCFEILENQVVNTEAGTISADTTHFSTFVLLYVPNWHTQFENNLSPQRTQWADVSFVIDESNSMEDYSKGTPNDPNRYRVTAAKELIDALLEGDRAAVIGFSDTARRKINLTGDLVAAKEAVDTIVGNAGGTALYTGLTESIDELIANIEEGRVPFIVALTDGEDSSSNEAAYNEIISKAKINRIPIFTIGLGSSVNTALLVRLAQETGGDYFRISAAEDLPNAFKRIVNNAVYGEDTDGDGLADAVEKHGIRDGLGKIYFTDPYNADTDGDGLPDGYEVGDIYSYDETGESFYIILSDPLKEDTDNDGFDDYDELMFGTKTWCADTDGDGLNDGFEHSVGYDPLRANADGDAYNDYMEYYNENTFGDQLLMTVSAVTAPGTYALYSVISFLDKRDPFDYDHTLIEKYSIMLSAVIIGDFGDVLANCGIMRREDVWSLYYIVGNLAGNFIPVIGTLSDIRDLIANIILGDAWGIAANTIGVIPLAGDALQAASEALKQFAKVADDSRKLTKLIDFAAETFPVIISPIVKAGEGIKWAQKVIAEQAIELCKAAKKKLVKTIKALADAFGPAVKVFTADDLADGIIKISDEIWDDVPVNRGKKIAALSKTDMTAVRSIDLNTSTYMNADKLIRTLKKSLEDAIESGKKSLDIVIPKGIISEAQYNAISEFKKYAKALDLQISVSFKIASLSDEVVTAFQKNISKINKYLKAANVDMDPKEFLELVSKKADDLTDAQIDVIKAVNEAREKITGETVLVKILSKNDYEKYYANGFDKLGGFVARADDVSDLKTLQDVYDGLSLNYKGTSFSLKDDCYYVIEFTMPDSSIQMLDIPYSPKLGGTYNDAFPFTGTGFTAGGYPEYAFKKGTRVEFNTANVFRISSDGLEKTAVKGLDSTTWEWFGLASDIASSIGKLYEIYKNEKEKKPEGGQ